MNYLLKICGITSLQDAEMVLSFSETKPEYLGFVFFQKSKRYITPEKAQKITEIIRGKYGENRVKFVGVFVNEDLNNIEIFEQFNFLDVLQLHGDDKFESPYFCAQLKEAIRNKCNINTKSDGNVDIWKAFRVKNISDLEKIPEYSMVDGILFDAFSTVKNEYGGSGKQVSKEILPLLRSSIALHQKMFIAGGITPENKDEILALSGADGIDLSSSVEISAGVKSVIKVQKLF